MPIATCFPYVYTHFPTFSGTNLLTRCLVLVPCFLLFLVSEKLFWKYSRNWTARRPKSLFSPEASRSPKESPRRAPGSHTMSRRGPTPGRAWTRCGPPGRPPMLPFRLFIPFLGKTLSTRSEFHEKFRSRHRHQP